MLISDSASVVAGVTVFWSGASNITINDGKLTTGTLSSMGAVGSVTLQADNPKGGSALVINADVAGRSDTFGGTISGPGTLEKSGASKQTLSGINNFGGLIINGGTLAITRNDRVAALTVGGSSAKLDLNPGVLMVTDSVNGIATSAADTAALAKVRDLLAVGYHNGAFDGNGIASTYAGGVNSHSAIGYARAADLFNGGGGTFAGQTLPAKAIIIANTPPGDATLDGAVGFADLVRLAQNYNSSGFWNNGDFNYDGIVDFNDLVKLAQNYGFAQPTQPIPGAPAGFDADAARAFAMVPEPGAAAVIGVVVMGLAIRRRL